MGFFFLSPPLKSSLVSLHFNSLFSDFLLSFFAVLLVLLFSSLTAPLVLTDFFLLFFFFFLQHLRTQTLKIVQEQEVCCRLLTPFLYPASPIASKRKHKRRRRKWEDELSPLYVSLNVSGFLCMVIHLNVVHGQTISGREKEALRA